jgi:hypothetical protein
MPWTVEQVLALAPDPSSAKSGKDLSAVRKWLTLGADSVCAWGTMQGSGKDPYQVSIDLSVPAFKCTCPSRKFPCKHGLGLLLILVQQPDACSEKQAPAWTTEWIAKRSQKEQTKATRAAEPIVPSDSEAEAKAAVAAQKRTAGREKRVSSGLDELGVWLEDLVRVGFTQLPGKPASFWETPAARLVDAQAPGLARRVRTLDGITTTGEGWPARLLRELSVLHLAREGWSRIATLPAPTQSDVRATLGFTVSQEEVLAQSGLRDRWAVTGQYIQEEERLRVRVTWLFGMQSKRPSLCLSFSAGAAQAFDIGLVPGTIVDAELVFFPGAFPLRALVKQQFGSPQLGPADFPHTTIEAANAAAAEAFGANPWLERFPLALAAVTPLRRAHGWIVRDDAGHFLPLDISEVQAWKLAALSGGYPVALSGEWDGELLCPLSVWAEGRFVPL